ncbi:MAG: hypothetical protein ACYCOU_01525 [Sulfobacillus sp.]
MLHASQVNADVSAAVSRLMVEHQSEATGDERRQVLKRAETPIRIDDGTHDKRLEK